MMKTTADKLEKARQELSHARVMVDRWHKRLRAGTGRLRKWAKKAQRAEKRVRELGGSVAPARAAARKGAKRMITLGGSKAVDV